MQRKAKVKRVTKETSVTLHLNLDGKGRFRISTTIPFLDHMLAQFALHSGFDLYINASGDTDVDDHHLVEDIGLCLGAALFKCLSDKRGINRYGETLTPMDEALSYVVVDISGRPYLDYKVRFLPEYKKSTFDFRLIREFMKSLVNEGKFTLHIKVLNGEDNHHICESIFKGLGRTLAQAVARGKPRSVLPTTKGKL